MKMTTSREVTALFLSTAMALSGCAMRAPPAAESPNAAAPAAGADSAATSEAKKEEAPPPPPPPPAPEPKSLKVTEIDESDPVRALADAESLLDASLGRKKSGPARNDGSAPPAKEEPAADTCSIACRALASMRRSADRLCQLAPSASPDAPRCNDAKDRVTKAEQRVRERCAACAEAP
jgi:hypothetical protein